MRELSLNILDVAENSVKAKASLIEIYVEAGGNLLTLRITDNGCGMDKEFVARVTDPFTTTRTTRKVGLGLPFLKQEAEVTGGSFSVESELGKGTTVTATFVLDSIDRAPLGDLADTMLALLAGADERDFVFTYVVEGRVFVFDTRDLKAQLGGIPVATPEVLVFIREMLEENIKNINGGAIL